MTQDPRSQGARFLPAALAASVWAFSAVAFPQTPPLEFCEPSPEVQAELRIAVDKLFHLQPQERTYEKSREIFGPLLEKHPDDLHIHRAFLNSIVTPGPTGQEALVTEYTALAASHKGNPAFEYLRAAALLRAGHPEEARQLFQIVASSDPSFPWAHFALAGFHARSKDAADRSKGRPELEKLFSLCPDALDGFSLAIEVDDVAFQKRAADRLRVRLETTTGDEDRYPVLWALEYEVTPNADAYRSRVNADLARLRRKPLTVPRALAILAGIPKLGETPEDHAMAEEVYQVYPTLSPRIPRGWQRLLDPLPDFQLKDVAGKTWTRASLKGKTVLINFWATWCGPCRAELPKIQSIWEAARGRKEVLVLTFNTDRDEKLVKPFLKRNGYQFPVLFASTFLQKNAAGGTVIPQTWIVSKSGDLVRLTFGFTNGDPKWREKILALLEEVGRESPPKTE